MNKYVRISPKFVFFLRTFIWEKFSHLYPTQEVKSPISRCSRQFHQALRSSPRTSPESGRWKLQLLSTNYRCKLTLFIFPLSTNFKPFRGSSADVDVLEQRRVKIWKCFSLLLVGASYPEWVPLEPPLEARGWGMPGRFGIMRVPTLLWETCVSKLLFEYTGWLF